MLSPYLTSRLPLFYVFLSGIGFSFQTLIIKVLAERGFHASFQCIFFRGFVQFLLASYFVYYDTDRLAGKGPSLFGNSSYVKLMLFLRSFVGFGGIAFSFLAVELIPMGDATVLIMLSPLITAILSYFILGEPWRLPELVATLVSLTGVVMVAKPPSIFGGNVTETGSFYKGVGYGLVSAVSAAFAYLFVRILGTTAKMPWSNVCFSQSIAQMVLSIPCLYIFGQHIQLDIGAFKFGMLILGGTIGAWSQILMTMGMQREKSAAATGMRMSDVAFGYLWQVLFTADALSLLSLGGAALVASSILIILYFKEGSSAGSAGGTTPVESGSGKGVELSQMRSTLHSSLSLEELYDMEDGFADSDNEGSDHARHHPLHRNTTGAAQKTETFNFAALKASLDADLDADWAIEGSLPIGSGIEDKDDDADHGASSGRGYSENNTSTGGSGGGELDLSLHGEHGGLLDASQRMDRNGRSGRSASGGGRGFLTQLSAPLFGASDGSL